VIKNEAVEDRKGNGSAAEKIVARCDVIQCDGHEEWGCGVRDAYPDGRRVKCKDRGGRVYNSQGRKTKKRRF